LLGLTWDEAKEEVEDREEWKSGDAVLPDVLPEQVNGLRPKVRKIMMLMSFT